MGKYYYLADGIYPKYRRSFFSAHHSSARKSVERVFGVLFRQFKIIYQPCRLQHIHEMNEVVEA